jgi:hypothetical protein
MDKKMQAADVKLTMLEKIGFGLGDLYSAGAQGLISAVYLVFLALNGIEPGLAATIVMISKVWTLSLIPPWALSATTHAPDGAAANRICSSDRFASRCLLRRFFCRLTPGKTARANSLYICFHFCSTTLFQP